MFIFLVKKILEILLYLAVFVLFIMFMIFVISGAGIGSNPLRSEVPVCQYQTRELVDGKCDNTDPACPESVKMGTGDCFKSGEAVLIQPLSVSLPETSQLVGK